MMLQITNQIVPILRHEKKELFKETYLSSGNQTLSNHRYISNIKSRRGAPVQYFLVGTADTNVTTVQHNDSSINQTVHQSSGIWVYQDMNGP